MYVNEVLFNEFRNGRSFVDLAAFFSKDFRFNDYSRTFSRSGKLYGFVLDCVVQVSHFSYNLFYIWMNFANSLVKKRSALSFRPGFFYR